MDTSARFKRLAENWFLTEPAFFAIFCTHQLAVNHTMSVPIRTGKGRIEYNPKLLEQLNDYSFEELVGIEMLRLFLKHPYERTPEDVSRRQMKIASDLTLTSHYHFSYHLLATPKQFNLPACKHYEWYLSHLPNLNSDEKDSESERGLQGKSIAGDISDQENGTRDDYHSAGSELTELWEEDESRQLEINELIENVKDWGTIPVCMSQTILANTRARIDYRRALRGFRASVIASSRCLTRMKPNRRTGFAHMGSKHDFSTRLLIAVDVSGSISDSMLSHFFSVIIKFFKYGVKIIDVIQFDTQIKGPAVSLDKVHKQKEFKVYGRGGTSFQPVFDYVEGDGKYDGLIILTDGYAPAPTKNRRIRTDILWVCESETTYNEHHQWMRQLGRVCYMDLI